VKNDNDINDLESKRTINVGNMNGCAVLSYNAFDNNLHE
jgi:hypothetical protein